MAKVRVVEQVMKANDQIAAQNQRMLDERNTVAVNLMASPGAGKTSILDAMCFALYGVSSGADRRGKQMRSDHADLAIPTEVTFVDASAILDGNELKVFLTNRGLDEEAPLEIHLADRPISTLKSAELLTGPGPKAANSFEEPNLIRSQEFKEVLVSGGRATLALPPLSVVAMTLELGA